MKTTVTVLCLSLAAVIAVVPLLSFEQASAQMTMMPNTMNRTGMLEMMKPNLNPGMMNPGMMNPGMMNPGMMNPGMMNPGMMEGMWH
jgi:hypothetical protein